MPPSLKFSYPCPAIKLCDNHGVIGLPCRPASRLQHQGVCHIQVQGLVTHTDHRRLRGKKQCLIGDDRKSCRSVYQPQPGLAATGHKVEDPASPVQRPGGNLFFTGKGEGRCAFIQHHFALAADRKCQPPVQDKQAAIDPRPHRKWPGAANGRDACPPEKAVVTRPVRKNRNIASDPTAVTPWARRAYLCRQMPDGHSPGNAGQV